MPNRLTIEFIKEECLKLDYVCISNNYINNRTKLKFICPLGHEFETIWNSFQLGFRCSECSPCKKKTIDDVINFCERINYTCISNEYKNVDTKLNLICENGHNCQITFKHLQKGVRCSECVGCKKKNIDFIKEYSKQYNYTCTSTENEYKNNKNKLNFICPDGHLFKMSWHSFKRGYRCTTCATLKTSGENHHKWNTNRDEITLNKRLRKVFSKNWIIKNMKTDVNYDNYIENPNDYSVDHIIPVSLFCKIYHNYNLSENDLKKIVNNRHNLQLLTMKENILKSNKGYSIDDAKIFVESLIEV